MNPAAPVTSSCIARTLLALRARFSDLAPAALDLLRPIEVLKRLAALALLGQSAAEVVLGIGLIELAGSLQLRNGLPRDGLGVGDAGGGVGLGGGGGGAGAVVVICVVTVRPLSVIVRSRTTVLAWGSPSP